MTMETLAASPAAACKVTCGDTVLNALAPPFYPSYLFVIHLSRVSGRENEGSCFFETRGDNEIFVSERACEASAEAEVCRVCFDNLGSGLSPWIPSCLPIPLFDAEFFFTARRFRILVINNSPSDSLSCQWIPSAHTHTHTHYKSMT